MFRVALVVLFRLACWCFVCFVVVSCGLLLLRLDFGCCVWFVVVSCGLFNVVVDCGNYRLTFIQGIDFHDFGTTPNAPNEIFPSVPK